SARKRTFAIVSPPIRVRSGRKTVRDVLIFDNYSARPTYGRPVYVRPQSQLARSTTHAPVFRQPRSSVSAIGNRGARTAATSHSVAPNSAVRPSDNARNHIL